MRAVILAGGQGVRLRPYTTSLPKPLVPIGDEYPILEIVVKQLVSCGFTHLTLTVSHLSNLIRAFFGDGSQWKIKIDYSLESQPLSTIGPLTLIEDLPAQFLVMNGDVLCDLDYGAFYRQHLESGAAVTVSTFKRDAKIDFGVLQYDEDGKITGFTEKPIYHFDVSMGVYCLSRHVIEELPKGQRYGFDNLMVDGIRNGQGYCVKPFGGFWLDIGRPEDYDYANEHYPEIKRKLGI